MKQKTKKKESIHLPVQSLRLSAIRDIDNLCKIFFQFDVNARRAGRPVLTLVAYPAYYGGKNQGLYFGKKIKLTVQKPLKMHALPVPITLGNLEISFEELKSSMNIDKSTKLILRPRLFKANAHAEYMITDGTSTVEAKPSPPAPPSA
jgi:hypothetical protein